METEEKLHQLYRKKHNSKNQFLNQVLSKKEIFLPQNSEGTMIEVTFLSELITKTLFPNLSGKYQSNPLTITTTFLFSSTEQDKNTIHTDHLQSLEHTISQTKEVTKFCQLFLNLSFQSKVFFHLFSCIKYKRSIDNCNNVKNHSKTCTFRRNDWISFGSLLQTNSSYFQHFQKQQYQHW